MTYSWSFSAYSAAVTCLRKFDLQFLQGIKSGENDVNLCFGQALHSGLNQALYDDTGVELFEVFWDSYKDKPIIYGRFGHKELRVIGVNFIAKFKKFYAPKFKVLKAEVRLHSEYKGVKLEGTMDVLAEYDGVVTLGDFKTTSKNYDEDRTVTATQLFLYSYLCMKELGIRPEQTMYLPFNKGTGSIQKPLIRKLEDKEMYTALDNMLEYLDIMGKGVYPKQYGACFNYERKCEFFDTHCHKKEKE